MATSRKTISDFQKVLLNSGFNPGTIDGKWGSNTKGAMNQYQQSRGLATSALPGSLTIQTLNSESPGREDPPIILNLASLTADIKAYIAEKKSEQEAGVIEPSDPAITPDEMSVYFGEEKKGLPWWGWALIGVGVVGAVVGGVYIYKHYKKGRGRGGSSYGEIEEEPNDNDGLTCALNMTREEKALPRFTWGASKSRKVKA